MSTEETVIQYVKNIIVPYIERVRSDIGNKKTALVIIDNFKGEVTLSMLNLLESNNILVSPLPTNTTDVLQLWAFS